MTLTDRCLNFLTRRIHGSSRQDPSLDTLKCTCLELIEDVNPDRRTALSHSILNARHRGDVWDLRSALFGGVSMSFGEAVARERVARLDNLMA